MTHEISDRSPNQPTPISSSSVTKKVKAQHSARKPAFPPDQDITLWLSTNAPTTFDELIDIRYSLYHRCSRAGYRVKRLNDEELSIAGRLSLVHIMSNQARRFLLRKLRDLAKENRWQGALPRVRAGRRAKERGPHSASTAGQDC